MNQRPLDTFFELQPRIIDRVETPVDRGEILRYLGYPANVAPNSRLTGYLDRWIEEAAKCAIPRATYRVLPVVEKDKRRLCLESTDGVVEFHGAIGEFLGASLAVAVFIATAGPNIERLSSKMLREGDELAALIVNAVGAERAEAAEAVVIDQLRRQADPIGFAQTLPYSPGYCGMNLTEQNKLFALFGDKNVGVILTSACLMRPLKSVSGLIGLGPADQVEAFGSPCDRCELHTCSMRR